MIVGIGVDLVDVPRFERSLARTPRLRERLFTPAERDLPLRSLAARYAAKEALIKALGGSEGVTWTQIEVARMEGREAPRFELFDATSATVAARGVTRLHLSLSHDAGLAIAYVVAEGDEDPDASGSAPAGDAAATRVDPAPGTGDPVNAGEIRREASGVRDISGVQGQCRASSETRAEEGRG